ncbi:MAG: hypothetical protein Kow0062_19890 [Acidobacteriota bacterium]
MARERTARHDAGFSLPELLVSLAIGGILLGIAYTSLQSAQWRTSSAAAVLVRQLDLARSKAVFEQNDYVVEFVAGGSQITILDDDNSDGSQTTSIGEKLTTIDLASEGRGVRFGFATGTPGLDGSQITKAVTFPGSPPRLTFDALGRAQSGVIYLIPEEDVDRQVPDHMVALSVNAATGRIRRWRYDSRASTPGPWRLER